MSDHHFHRLAGPFAILLFYYFIPLGSRQEVFASRAAKPECRTTIFTGRPDRLLFYYFTISFPLGSRQEVFASRAAKLACLTTIFTGWPNRLLSYYFTISFPLGSRQEVFASRAAKPECRTTISPVGGAVYYFTISLFHFHWVPGRRFLHLAPQNLNVGPPFSPSGRRRLLFYYFTISFPLGSRQEVFASRAAKPECRTTIFTGRPDRLLFYYFTISFPLGSRQEVFASRAAKPECRTTIFTGRPDRLLFYYFTISFPLGSRQEVFASRAAKPECQTPIFTGRPAVFASRAAKPECRTTITGRPDRLLFYFLNFHWVPGKRFLHLGPQNLNVGPPFHRSVGPFTILLFHYFISIGFQAGGFCISGRKT